MLDTKQLDEIREHLAKAQNPVFFFDNDCDGLISFILLRRYIGRGRGVAIKSFPGLEDSYVKRVEELNADYIFILDKPIVSKEFFKEVKEKNIPVVWIDHHEIEPEFDESFVSYYNPVFEKEKSSEPVSYLAYKIANKKQDMWLSMIGCIADNFVPDFAEEFAKQYPELWKKTDSAFEILYDSEFGEVVKILDFALKDRTSNVVSMLNFLFKVSSPIEILKEDNKNHRIHKRYSQVNEVYSKLIEKAKKVARNSKDVIFFQYGGELSLSSHLSNELSYRFPGKVIIVAYLKGAIANVSVRGAIDVREITMKAIEEISGASGGGHEHATGARMNSSDLEKFVGFFRG